MLAFLHTADVHVETFGLLAREVDASIPVRHEVRPDLLATAIATGALSDVVRSAVGDVLQELARAGARVIVCTCSTIGALAEAAVVPDCAVLRIDRPVAEKAVSSGCRVLVVAALPTALQQTLALLRQIAADEHRSPEIVESLCGSAWALFERGDASGYLAEVANTISLAAAPGDLVLLAQASMLPVAALVARSDIDIFSSPRLGVQAAFSMYRSNQAALPNSGFQPAGSSPSFGTRS